MPVDRKTFLADPALLSSLGAHIRARVPASDADDVLQSVLADALAAEGAPDDGDALRRWLFGVARNKIADFYRRARREQPTDAIDDGPAPSSGNAGANDLLRWAEGELPPGSEAKRTLEWMMREGEGEKLEAIAASEKLPAPRVRKRVSRMREHFRARWAAYVAALAAAGLAVFIVVYILRRKPVPEARIVPEPRPSATAPLVPALSTSAPPRIAPSAIPSASASASVVIPPRPVPTQVPRPTSTTAPRRPRSTSMTPSTGSL